MAAADESAAAEPDGITRRDALRRGATVAGGAAVVGAGGSTVPRYSPVGRVEAIAPVLVFAAGAAAGGVTGAGVGVLVSGTFGPDEDEVMQAEANELHDELYAWAVEQEPSGEDFLDSMANSVDLLAQNVRRDVSFAVADGVAQGTIESESAAMTAAEDQVGTTVKGYQERLLQAWDRQVTTVAKRYEQVLNEQELSKGDVFAVSGSGSRTDINNLTHLTDFETFIDLEADFGTQTVDLVDGTQRDCYGAGNGTSSSEAAWDFNPTTAPEDFMNTFLEVKNREGSGTGRVLDSKAFYGVWNDLETLSADEKNNVQWIVETLYQPLANGEVSAHEVASGSAIMDGIGEIENYQQAAGAFRSIAMPEAERACIVEISGVKLEGIMFWSTPSEDGLPVGETISPENEIGDFYMGAEVREIVDEELEDDWSEVESGDAQQAMPVQLTEEFTITGIDGGSGGPLTFEEVNHIEPRDEGDQEAILAAIRDAHDQREETRSDRQEIIVNSGGNDLGLPDWLDSPLDSLPGWAWWVGGGAAALIGYNRLSGN